MNEMFAALLTWERPSDFFTSCPPSAELAALIGLEQDPVFHPEGDVWTHTMLVVDKAAGLRDQAENPLGFMLAALCHDLGKASTTERVGERIHAYGHEEAGIVPAREFLSRFSVEQETEDYVLNMILLHMKPNLMAAQRSGLKAMCRLFDRSVSPNDLLLLAKCDHGVGDYAETACWLWTQYDLFQARMAMPYVTKQDLIGSGFAEHLSEGLEYAHKLRLAGVEKDSALKQTAAFLRKMK